MDFYTAVFLSALGESPFALALAAGIFFWFFAAGQHRRARLFALALGLAVIVVSTNKALYVVSHRRLALEAYRAASGHAMLAAAIFPVLARCLSVGMTRTWCRVMVGLGGLLALLIGISRLRLSAHTPAEVVVGLAIGAIVSILVMRERESWPAGQTRSRLVAALLPSLLLFGVSFDFSTEFAMLVVHVITIH